MDHPARHWTGAEPARHRTFHAANTTACGGPAQAPTRTSNAQGCSKVRPVEGRACSAALKSEDRRPNPKRRPKSEFRILDMHLIPLTRVLTRISRINTDSICENPVIRVSGECWGNQLHSQIPNSEHGLIRLATAPPGWLSIRPSAFGSRVSNGPDRLLLSLLGSASWPPIFPNREVEFQRKVSPARPGAQGAKPEAAQSFFCKMFEHVN